MNVRAQVGARVEQRSVEGSPVFDGPRTNPFTSALALAQSSYAAFQDGRLVRASGSTESASPLARLVHDCFRALVLSPEFSCLGAKAAVGSSTYRTAVYGELGSPGATA